MSNPLTGPNSSGVKEKPLEATAKVSLESSTNATSREDTVLRRLSKTNSNQARDSLAIPSTGRARSQSPDTLSLISADDFSELRQVRSVSLSQDAAPLKPEQEEQHPGWRGRIKTSWTRNKGLFYVLIAQLFGTLMNTTTRLLEGESNGAMHPFQILFARMTITCFFSSLYMWWKKTPDFPLGAKEVRWILVARGVGGFFGVYGLYWSLQYLPLADATVLTFLAPFLTCAVCAKLLHEPFTRAEQVGGFISLIGVVLIARPTAIFSHDSDGESKDANNTPGHGHNSSTPTSNILLRSVAETPKVSSAQRLAAVGMAMLGVIGASIAYITIRWIGKRAHPLISVNYFAVWCTIVSTIALIFVPSIPFVLPSTWNQWGLLSLIGIGGFVMQFLLTAGLRYEKSSRATNMIYSQMLFAVAADRLIWGEVPSLTSLGGSALILGSAIVVAVQKEGKTKNGAGQVKDEEAALVEGLDSEGGEGEEMEVEMESGREVVEGRSSSAEMSFGNVDVVRDSSIDGGALVREPEVSRGRS